MDTKLYIYILPGQWGPGPSEPEDEYRWVPEPFRVEGWSGEVTGLRPERGPSGAGSDALVRRACQAASWAGVRAAEWATDDVRATILPGGGVALYMAGTEEGTVVVSTVPLSWITPAARRGVVSMSGVSR